MPLPSQTINEIYALIISDIEAALSQTIPIIPKAVWRRVAMALAGAWLILYKYGTQLHRERFVQTASIEWLRLLGELVAVNQQAASTWAGTASIICTGSVGAIDAGTQFLNSLTGVVYLVETGIIITPGTLVLSLFSGSSGDIGNLTTGDVLDIVSPLAGVALTATAVATTQSGDDAEDVETYRQRVLNAYQKKPQGGATTDYEQWGLEAPNVINIYPYAAATPGEVDIYVEVDNQVDGIPDAAQLDETEEYLLYDPVTGRRTRRPITATLNMLAITRREFDVEVISLSPDTPANRTAIDDALEAYMLERAPYIRGLSLMRTDTISQIEVTALIFQVLNPLGATIASCEVSDIGGPVYSYTLLAGEKSKIGVVTYA